MNRKKISKIVITLLIAAFLISPIAAGAAKTTTEPTLSVNSNYKTDNMNVCSSVILWNNNMSYIGLLASQFDEITPFDAYSADDFHFVNDTMVNIVRWVGGYWNTNYSDGDFNWGIVYYVQRIFCWT